MILCEWFSWSYAGNILRDILVNAISGLLAFFVGYFFYKKLKKKQTIAEVEIQNEINIQYIVNEFKRMREKYNLPLEEKVFSPRIEEEISFLYQRCCTVRDSCINYSLELDSDVMLLMNFLYAQKGVLYCNNTKHNQPPIENETFKYFDTINKMKAEGIGFNIESNREVYFQLLQMRTEELDKVILMKSFFKKYWKY